MAIIVPEVYANLVTEKVKGKVKISQLADTLGVLSGNVGDTVTFPMFKALSDAVLMAKGDTITPEQLAQTSSSKKIMQYGKGVKVYDIEEEVALGRMLENGAEQQARIFARALDNEMVKDIDTNAILKSATVGANAITESELINGFQLFGDEQDNDEFAGIVINSLLAPSFYAMNGFIKSDVTYSKEGNGIIRNGVIGFYRGTIPVILSDVNTYDSTKLECKSYIIKKGALVIMPKRNILVEEQRHAETKSTDLYCDMIFATGLIMKDGVVIVRKTIV
jgi:hypothetical protein